MKRLFLRDIVYLLVIGLLGGIALYQGITTYQDYARTWLARSYSLRKMTSFERSANIYLRIKGTEFIKFLDSVVPQNGSVVVPDKEIVPPASRANKFSEQSILQFFMVSRGIIACGCTSSQDQCNTCVQTPHHFVPAVMGFPPPGSIGDSKDFIPFDQADDDFFGVYVPKGYNPSNNPAQAGATGYPFPALFIDLVVILGLIILGYLIVNLIHPAGRLIEKLSLAAPIGSGILSWSIFLASWAGLRIQIATVAGVYAVLCMVLTALYFRRKQNPFASLAGARLSLQKPSLSIGSLSHWIIWIGISIWLLAGVTISVGRGYSTFDDMAIWSLKGYGMADEGTIFAGGKTGGHGLAYPLNLSLSIAVFKLASGDVLPGSKLLYALFIPALLIGCFSFWRRREVDARIAAVGILVLLTVPQVFLFSTLGFANYPFAVYLTLGCFWSIEGWLAKRSNYLLMGGLLLALAGWTRPEGILFALVLMAAMVLVSWLVNRQLTVPLPWLLPLIVPVIWLFFARSYIQSDQAGTRVSTVLQRIGSGELDWSTVKTLVNYASDHLQSPAIWGAVLPVSALCILVLIFIGNSQKNPTMFYLLSISLCAFLIPAGLFFIESQSTVYFIPFLDYGFDRAYIPFVILFFSFAVILASGLRTPGFVTRPIAHLAGLPVSQISHGE